MTAATSFGSMTSEGSSDSILSMEAGASLESETRHLHENNPAGRQLFPPPSAANTSLRTTNSVQSRVSHSPVLEVSNTAFLENVMVRIQGLSGWDEESVNAIQSLFLSKLHDANHRYRPQEALDYLSMVQDKPRCLYTYIKSCLSSSLVMIHVRHAQSRVSTCGGVSVHGGREALVVVEKSTCWKHERDRGRGVSGHIDWGRAMKRSEKKGNVREKVLRKGGQQLYGSVMRSQFALSYGSTMVV